jgi:pimeloyl-ACP methyl ester carboxylesterase
VRSIARFLAAFLAVLLFLPLTARAQGQDFYSGARIKDIRVPALVIVGEDEDHGASGPLTHLASAKLLSENLPNAKLIVLKGQGHYYYFSDPQTLNSAIRDFIASE